jgi:hypothetical protein
MKIKNSAKKFALVLSLTLLTPTILLAEEAATEPAATSADGKMEAAAKKFFFAGQGVFEYTSTTAVAGSSTPTIFTEGVGFLGTYRFTDMWMAGLSTDFTFINQTSDPGTTGTNFSGTRWNILSPVVGAFIAKHLIILDLQFLGNWVLKTSAANTGTAQYTNPLGFRVRYLYPLSFIKNLSVGGQFEYLSFSSINNSISGSSTVSPNQTLTEIGVLLAYTL